MSLVRTSTILQPPSALMPSLSLKLGSLTGERPTLLTAPPDQHGTHWTCPKTGLVIPKTLDANLRWRQRILAEARTDDGLQSQLRAACSESIWFWLNAFCYTYRQKRVLEDGRTVPCTGHHAHVPFITWKVQDQFLAELVTGIETGQDILIDKSREMGASWLCLSVFHWFWQFRPACSFLEVSRNEILVDKIGDMDSLFEKHRYLNRWQPFWMIPRRVEDKYLHLGNGDNGSVIKGESTNGDVGRGGRKTACLLDEFAAVLNGDEIDGSTADTTACRIFNSTPKGPGTAFHKIKKERRAKVLELPWWHHPEKGRGAFQIFDSDGKVKWRSPWWFAEEKRRDAKWMAQEVDMDHGKAGDSVFAETEIEAHRAAHQKPPVLVGNLALADDYGDEKKKSLIARVEPDATRFTPGGEKPGWRFWLPLVNGRPPQDVTYTFGVDISNGANASNSCITVIADELNMVVAKYWRADISPDELGELAAFAGQWFGGANGMAFVCWENNGPGSIFGRRLVKLGYRSFYFQRQDNTKAEAKTTRYGWHSNPDRKGKLLAEYRCALAKDEVIQPCRESLDECLDYIYDAAGTPIPGKLREETHGGRALHGDHVIADALAHHARAELPNKKGNVRTAPQSSFAGRRDSHRQKLKSADHWRD
jgi:hypothetical protein